MGFHLKLFGFMIFMLSTLSFCQAKNVTVKLIGAIHCTDCIRREFSNSQASLGVDVVITCKSKKSETKTQGNSAIDKEGKFNVTLSAENNSIESCLAKLQTASSSSPCPLQSAQTATVELLSTNQNATQASYNRPTTIEFSPLTCQSAFFWPMPNLTFFSPPQPEPPVDYVPPPSDDAFSPVEAPLPPVEESVPPPAPASEPSYLPPPPTLSAPTPAPASLPPLPIYNKPPPLPPLNEPIPPPNPIFQKPIPPPLPPLNKPIPPPLPPLNKPIPPPLPPLNEPIPPPSPYCQNPIPSPSPKQTLPKPPPYNLSPILPPTLPKKHKKDKIKTPIAAPIPVVSAPPPLPETPNPPPPLPKHETPAPAASPIVTSTPPSERKPSIIPRAPPVPQLPPIPQVPRKYFNAPKSKSKPPHSL